MNYLSRDDLVGYKGTPHSIIPFADYCDPEHGTCMQALKVTISLLETVTQEGTESLWRVAR